jgi:hypothetical protein
LNKLYNQEKDIVLVPLLCWTTILMLLIHFYQTFDSLDAIVQDYITELEKMDIEVS